MRWSVVVVACAACGADIEDGTYRVTGHTLQNGNPGTLGDTFTVTKTSDGIELADAGFLPSAKLDVPRGGGGYAKIEYVAGTNSCEAGGGKHCTYTAHSIDVSAPSSGAIRIEQCTVTINRTSCNVSPDCGDAAKAKKVIDDEAGILWPCKTDEVIDGELMSATARSRP